MQSSSSNRPFKPGLAGASPATDARWLNASCPRSSVRSERHRAKVEVAGAIPAVDAILPLCLSSNRASFVNSYSSVQFRPGAPFYGDHDVTAASRPVKAFVPVRVRLVTPFGRAQALQRAVDRGLSRLGSSGLIPLRRFGGGGVTQAHRANSHGRSLARINSCAQNPFDGPKLWVIACCWFESNLLDKMGQKLKG